MIREMCVKCRKELRCVKNEVKIVHYLNDDEEQGFDSACTGDLYECPVCSHQVIMGLGNTVLDDELLPYGVPTYHLKRMT